MLHEREQTSCLLQAKFTNTRTHDSLIRIKEVVGSNPIPVTSNGNIMFLHVQALYYMALIIDNNKYLIMYFITSSEQRR